MVPCAQEVLAKQSSTALARQRSEEERFKRQQAERARENAEREADVLDRELSQACSAISDARAGMAAGAVKGIDAAQVIRIRQGLRPGFIPGPGL